jgi:hypothetical protein
MWTWKWGVSSPVAKLANSRYRSVDSEVLKSHAYEAYIDVKKEHSAIVSVDEIASKRTRREHDFINSDDDQVQLKEQKFGEIE